MESLMFGDLWPVDRLRETRRNLADRVGESHPRFLTPCDRTRIAVGLLPGGSE